MPTPKRLIGRKKSGKRFTPSLPPAVPPKLFRSVQRRIRRARPKKRITFSI